MQTFVDNDNAAFAAELSPPQEPSERKRRIVEDEEMGDTSPKRSSHSTRSSATLGANTPQETSPGDSSEIGMNEPELPAPMEMTERGGISVVAKAAFDMEQPAIIDEKIPDTDEDMPDVEHIERSSSREREGRKYG
jgi:hypothetical protein